MIDRSVADSIVSRNDDDDNDNDGNESSKGGFGAEELENREEE